MDISGEIGKIVRRILGDIRVELQDEFTENFTREAFFSQAWARRRSPINSGSAVLTGSGELRRSVQSEVSADGVRFFSDLPYAGIHNEGGEIVVTDRMKRFFRYKFYSAMKMRPKVGGTPRKGGLSDGGFYHLMQSKNCTPEAEFWGYMALKRVGSTIKIPARRFIGESEEVRTIVRTLIESELINYFKHEFKLKK